MKIKAACGQPFFNFRQTDFRKFSSGIFMQICGQKKEKHTASPVLIIQPYDRSIPFQQAFRR